MLFNSMHFVLFFPVVALFYYLLPHRHRWKLLLVASYYFYMSWKPAYALLILTSTVIDYFAAIGMERCSATAVRRVLLGASLATNLGLLFAFKYLDFALGSIEAVVSATGMFLEVPTLDLLLPVGISFYTFQTLSYSIDVYRRDTTAEHHFGYFALFVSFFPQLVAGPIERSKRLIPELRKRVGLRASEVLSGLRLMAWGLAKKVIVADRIALIVDPIYDSPQSHDGMVLTLATVAFAFQIYCDFSGYSDIAIGAARVLGIRLNPNFNRPYAAASFRDFWRRWHISLSQWFRDYVYIPLGGSRRSYWVVYRNLMIAFAVSGLWHGASWTFVVWGALHGCYLCMERATSGVRARCVAASGLGRYPRVYRALCTTLTLSLVCFAWIFFRANSLQDALYICSHLTSGWELRAVASAPEVSASLGVSSIELGIAVGSLMVMELVQWAGAANGKLAHWFNRDRRLRWALYQCLIVAVVLLGVADGSQFIYFQF